MEKQSEKLGLKNLFPQPSLDEWRKAVESELKGAPFEKKMFTKIEKDITLKPIYTKEDIPDAAKNEFPGFGYFLRGNKAAGYHTKNWEIHQEIKSWDAKEFNSELRHDLERGLNAVKMNLDSATLAGLDADYADKNDVGNGGLSISALPSFTRALEGVDLTKHPFHIDCGFSALPFLMLFRALLKENSIDPGKISGSLTSDPVGFQALSGYMPNKLTEVYNEIKTCGVWISKEMPSVKWLHIDASVYDGTGADRITECAYVAATLSEYMHEMISRGITPDTVASGLKITLNAGSTFFADLAKIRAMRSVIAKIFEAYRVESANYILGIKSSSYNKTITDIHVNMLRTTTECFTGIAGGADFITTIPFDDCLGTNDRFSRRIARNTQIILREESNLRHVTDPGGGSYFIESLSVEMAEKIWNKFQEIEDHGGMTANLKSGTIQKECLNNLEEISTDIAKRKTVLVGSNMYANISEEIRTVSGNREIFEIRKEYLRKFRSAGNPKVHEKVLNKLQALSENPEELVETGAEAFSLGATLGEICRVLRSGTDTEAVSKLEKTRASAKFESLRFSSLKFKESKGRLPEIFLANMGSLKQFKARADFSKGFFEAGGFRINSPAGFMSADEAVEAAISSNGDAVVICSTDEAYPDFVPAIARGIKNKKPGIKVILAGYPKEHIEIFRAAGIDDFIYLGADAARIISGLYLSMGIEL